MRPFCRENMDYIVEDDNYVKVMVETLRSGSTTWLIRLIDWKYFDVNHPENHNIRYYNEKNETINIFDGKEWITKSITDAILELLDRLANDIDNFIGYAKSQKMKLDVRKFTKLIAHPLKLDMMYIDCESSSCDEVTNEDKKGKIIKAIQAFFRKKSLNEKNSIKK